MKNAKVTIVIPVYNGSDYLREAIDSALFQTYRNIEILVINDGSDDGGKTEKTVLSYGDKLRYFSKPNGGVASALNRAVEEMTGEYFSWLSHDDLYEPNKIEIQVNALTDMGRDDLIIYSDYSIFTDDPDNAQPVFLPGVAPNHFRHWITVENKLHGCALLIPRDAFNKVGVFNEALKTTQDYDLWYRMAGCYQFVHIRKQLVKARSHPDQGSIRMGAIALNECNSLLSGFIDGLDANEISSATGKELVDSYEDIASSMFKRGFDEAGKVAEKYAQIYGERDGIKVVLGKQKSIRNRSDRIVNLCRKYLPRQVKRAVKAITEPLFSRPCSENREPIAQLKEKFSHIYDNNTFGGRISRSGEGSDLIQTEIIRQEIPKIIREYSIRSLLDAPCGDWFWMKETKLGVEQYIGVDIVDDVIKKNGLDFGNSSSKFLCLNLVSDPLPKADLVFSRDCLVHLNFEDALGIIRNFKSSGAKYLLTTTFPDLNRNNDLVGEDGFWRPINLCLPPFNFPSPVLLVNEQCTEEAGQHKDKALGLWVLSDIDLQI